MSVSLVETFYKNHRDLYQHLIDAKQITFATEVSDNFRRSLVLAIASYFEFEITTILRQVSDHQANGNPIIAAMIAKKFIARQYHTYFDWDNLKPGPFWGLFGEDFKALAQKRMKDVPEFKDAVNAFLELGQARNLLVHQNYVQYAVDMTPEDIINQFRRVTPFIEFLRENLLSSSAGQASVES